MSISISRPTVVLRRRLAAAIVAIVAVTGAGLAAAAPANAYSLLTSSGRIGNVTIPTASASAAYYPGVAMTNVVFKVPGITVHRNGAIGTGTAQGISVIYNLQVWNGAAWTTIDSAQTSRYIPAGYTAAVTVGHTFQNPTQRAGNYRIAYSVGWSGYGSNSAAMWSTSAANELVCAVGYGRTCSQGAGYVYVK